MNAHTTWYPADDPADLEYDFRIQGYPASPQSFEPPYASPDDQSHSMPNLPFRFVTFGEGAPYPVHDSDHSMTQPQPAIFDLLSGENWQRVGSIRQPVAEDFPRPQHPLPAPPVDQHDSDQELEIIEPDSYLKYQPVIGAATTTGTRPGETESRHALATSNLLTVSKPDEGLNRSKSESNMPPNFSRPLLKQSTEVSSTPPQVPTMGEDMFSVALGGLHRLPSAPARKPSKVSRLKRFFSSRKNRQYGRASR
ncbi:hypothetical protein EK21DRAFT_109858 [Setomelanomma holmii]|uniref:Uncharacterized protein n=1 Tax=Setomelanomma holmii TaxID=210430 RepID=A0A9P4HDY9_9PLEO|nr:hypothetical protein EK21DRAFT_109858 [Setomelanomma holmii]